LPQCEIKVAENDPEALYKGEFAVYNLASVLQGGIAQLGERLHGMQEVSGSIPLTSTNRAGRSFAAKAAVKKENNSSQNAVKKLKSCFSRLAKD
jgi:hypothetical protein